MEISHQRKNENVELISIPLSSNTTAVVSQEIMNEQKLIFNSSMPVSRKLMIAKQKNGTTQMFIVTLIPDANSWMKLMKNSRSFRYLGGSDFSGLVFCSTLKGKFIEGYRYDNGRQTAPLHVHQCDQTIMEARAGYHGTSIRLRLTESTQVVNTYSSGETGGNTGSQTCSYCQNNGLTGGCPQCGRVTSGDIGEVVVTYCSRCHLKKDKCMCCPVCHAYPCKCCKICWNYPCSCPIPIDPELCEICHKNPCECHRCQYCGQLLCYGSCLGGGGGSGTGTGEDAGNTDPLKYIEKAEDRFAMNNIPRTMSSQLPNGCVLACMEYMNHLFGGTINQRVYFLDYWKTYHILPTESGISSNNIPEFINSHFNTKYDISFQQAISNGWVVITDIPSNIPNSSHAVVVVGYGPSGTLIYMDPEKGYLCENTPSQFGISIAIAITNYITKKE